MRLKKARQILKTFADDTRLRIISLLKGNILTVTDICVVLNKKQSNVSKHLTRLRLTGVVSDKRKGANVNYCLADQKDPSCKALLKAITNGLSDLEILQKDKETLTKLRKRRTR
ncbi:MAG: metalloregulator ArsR/SmtB family transcription factor [Candidatus Omnitrophota bacterium]